MNYTKYPGKTLTQSISGHYPCIISIRNIDGNYTSKILYTKSESRVTVVLDHWGDQILPPPATTSRQTAPESFNINRFLMNRLRSHKTITEKNP